ncbi:tetratricopeptide repeat-containing glycosyltransferase family 2 protein [Paenibacillus sinopodophylli]|uniref:tetratricopeptide repeat-containing glycosyltransferase family 2 protein n=1 Tax=Paenibacillus sinopodophylli TaxID=1837342 RepID=UPI00148718CA|nr:glycosyltransferase family 2 protein [Paenibacillus sinopodophylli]
MVEQQKLISLCMIVKDEEHHLPSCLQSVQGIVDEIVVVDTGSTDRTVAIAEQYGARVVLAEWEHDFAKARNAGLEVAQGEWILFLDADEELDAHSGRQLRAEASLLVEGLFLQIWNVVGAGDDERGGTVHPVLRMFRRDPEIRFEGSIHEQIAASILRKWPQAVFQLTEVKIIHYGYRQDVVIQKNKLRRNMELLERAVQQEPNNGFHRYNIGVEYLRAGMPGKALEAFRHARRQPGFEQLSYAHLVVKYEVRSLLALSEWVEAAEIARIGAEHFSDYPDLFHYEGLSLAQCGQLREAARAAEKALQIGAAPQHYHTEDGIGTYRTSYMLGRFREGLLDTPGVIEAYIAALRFHSTLMPPLYRLCIYLRVVGEEARLASILEAKLVCRSEDAVIKVADIMLACGCCEAAKAWVRWHAALFNRVDEQGLVTWLERTEADAILADNDGKQASRSFIGHTAEDEKAEATALFIEMCSHADRHLEQLQLKLKSGDALPHRQSTLAPLLRGASSAKVFAAIRLLIPRGEGWG